MTPLKFTVQSRSNKVDIFGLIPIGDLELVARPIEFKIGKRSTNPEHALITLDIKHARELARKILRAAGEEGS